MEKIEVIQINIFICGSCSKTYTESGVASMYSDPVISPPVNWGFIFLAESGETKLLCEKCNKEWEENIQTGQEH